MISPPCMNAQLIPTHIPNNPAADTRFTELSPAKVIGRLVNTIVCTSLSKSQTHRVLFHRDWSRWWLHFN